MSELRVARLFHGIVVVGAAVGCGQEPPGTRHSPMPMENPALDQRTDAAADPATAADCAAPQQFRCTAQFVAVDCYCDADAPLSAEACSGYGRFSCESYDPPTGCQCDTSILVR